MNNKDSSFSEAAKNNQKKEKFTKKLGDKLERAGEKISEKGAPGLGSAVRKLGDKIEHSQDAKGKAKS